MKDNYFYKYTNKVNGFSKDEYIKFLETQVIILREDNKRLIKKLEGITTINNSEFISKDKIKAKIEELEEAEQKEKKAYIDGTNVAHELCNKMWKDKIKAKIEEYERLSNNITMQPQIYPYIIDVLQSLLEKE